MQRWAGPAMISRRNQGSIPTFIFSSTNWGLTPLWNLVTEFPFGDNQSSVCTSQPDNSKFRGTVWWHAQYAYHNLTCHIRQRYYMDSVGLNKRSFFRSFATFISFLKLINANQFAPVCFFLIQNRGLAWKRMIKKQSRIVQSQQFTIQKMPHRQNLH